MRTPRTADGDRVLNAVLFLDIDGVLHPEPPHSGLTRLCWLPELAALLRPHPHVHVVLHSSWRHHLPQSYIAELMAPFGPQYAGTTSGPLRWPSIVTWLSKHAEVVDYLVLDDLAHEFPNPLPEGVVICPSRSGVTDPSTRERLRQWLAAS